VFPGESNPYRSMDLKFRVEKGAERKFGGVNLFSNCTEYVTQSKQESFIGALGEI
jgi:hypothetical protein